MTRPPSVFVRELSPDEGQRLRQLSRRHKQFHRSGRLGQPTRHTLSSTRPLRSPPNPQPRTPTGSSPAAPTAEAFNQPPTCQKLPRRPGDVEFVSSGGLPTKLSVGRDRTCSPPMPPCTSGSLVPPTLPERRISQACRRKPSGTMPRSAWDCLRGGHQHEVRNQKAANKKRIDAADRGDTTPDNKRGPSPRSDTRQLDRFCVGEDVSATA